MQFTRNPAGLAGALKKIGGFSYGSKLEAPHAEEASHMFFGNGMGESLFHLMDTHPPLAERIRAIDPSFDGTFPPVSFDEAESAAAPRVAAVASDRPFRSPSPACRRARGGLGGFAAADHRRAGRRWPTPATPPPPICATPRTCAVAIPAKPASRRARSARRLHPGLCAAC